MQAWHGTTLAISFLFFCSRCRQI